MIALADCNTFFASVERALHPGRKGSQGTGNQARSTILRSKGHHQEEQCRRILQQPHIVCGNVGARAEHHAEDGKAH